MKRYELAVIKRAFKLIFQYVKPRRIRLTADRGFPDDDLFALLDQLKINFIIRVKGGVKVFYRDRWVKPEHDRFRRQCATAQSGAPLLLREIAAPTLAHNEPCPK